MESENTPIIKGRPWPPKLTDELFDDICDRIASSSDSLIIICKDNGVDYRSFKRWLRKEENSDLREKYRKAKEDQADHLLDETIDIADDNSMDTKQVMRGREIVNVEDTEWTGRSKIRISTRQWAMERLAPKKYGKSLDITTGGSKLNPLSNLNTNELNQLILLQQKAEKKDA